MVEFVIFFVEFSDVEHDFCSRSAYPSFPCVDADMPHSVRRKKGGSSIVLSYVRNSHYLSDASRFFGRDGVRFL
jgi:hypothetical protein